MSSWVTGITAKAPAVQAPMVDRIKKLLEQEVELEIGGETMHKTMQFLLQAAKSDIPLRYLPPDQDVHIHPLKGKLPVGAWMQAIEDSNPSVCIVIRDYGLLLTTRIACRTGRCACRTCGRGTTRSRRSRRRRGQRRSKRHGERRGVSRTMMSTSCGLRRDARHYLPFTMFTRAGEPATSSSSTRKPSFRLFKSTENVIA